MKLKLSVPKPPSKKFLIMGEENDFIMCVNHYLKFLAIKSYSYNTIKAKGFNLLSLCQFILDNNIKPELITQTQLEKYVFSLMLSKSKSHSTCLKYFHSLISFYQYLDANHSKYRINQSIINNLSNKYNFEFSHSNKTTVNNKLISRQEFEILINTCNSVRDVLLLTLLYETGIRISEALSLFFEDIDIYESKIYITNHGAFGNGAFIKTVSSYRSIDCSDFLINKICEYINFYSENNIKCNHLFFKIRGKNKYCPMNYTDVDNLFRMLRLKTGIYVTPHMFRHTSLCNLYYNGWSVEYLCNRAGHKSSITTLNHYIHNTDNIMIDSFNNVKNL